jgi:hypothetical protein
MSTSDIRVHKAVVHSVNAETGICYVKIPAVTGQKIVKVGTEGLTENSQGIWNVPRVGDLCLVALSRGNADVTWVAGYMADLYRGDVNGVIEAINAWNTGDIQINQPGALATDLIIARHILAGEIITDKLAANAVTTSKLATDSIKSLNYKVLRQLPAASGSMAFNGTTLTVAGAGFRKSDVGRTVQVVGAGNSGGTLPLNAAIVDWLSSTQVTLESACLKTGGVSGVDVYFTSPPVGGFSDEGSFFDLSNGVIVTPGLYVDGGTGDVTVRGSVQATEFNLLDGAGDIVAELDTTNPVDFLQSGNALKFNHDDAQTVTTALTWSDAAALTATRTMQLRSPAYDGGANTGYTQLQFQGKNDGTSNSRQTAFLEAIGGNAYTGTAHLWLASHNDSGGAAASATLLAQYPIGGAGAPGGMGEAKLTIDGKNGTASMYGSTAGVTSTITATSGAITFAASGNTRMTVLPDYVLFPRDQGIKFGDVNHGLRSITASGGIPWCDGPELRGWNGWSFYSSQLARYEMGLRSNGSTVYFWNRSSMLVGSTPDDGLLTHTLRVQGSAYVSSTFGTGTHAYIAGTVHGDRAYFSGYQNSSDHGSQLVRAVSSGDSAGISLWPSNYGIAPVLRCFSGNGESIDCGNNPGTGYAQFGANNFVTWSARRGKKNIRTRGQAEKDEFRERFARIKTVIYDDAVGEMKVAKTQRFSDLNKKWVESGKSPLTPNPDRDFESVEHDCDQNPCNGTSAEPCGIVRRHRNRRGIVAEELLDVLPQAVSVNMFGETMGVDYGVITVELVDIVQDLLEEVEELKLSLKRGK